MKNVLLLCMSAIAENRMMENQYIYTLDNGKEKDDIWGFTTNEAPMRYVLKNIAPHKLDRIIIICSDKVTNGVIKKENCNTTSSTKGAKHGSKEILSFKENIERLFPKKAEIKLLDYYKKLVELEIKEHGYTPEYDYIPDYKEIRISDNPEDTEIAKAVIAAVENVMEFPEENSDKESNPNEDKDIHLYIDYNGGPRYVAFMQVVLAQFLQTRQVHLEQIITMNFENKKDGKIAIQNLLSIFDSTNLIGRVNEYINYGRIEGLEEYFSKAQSEEIKDLLNAMKVFSNNLQLCRTGYIMGHTQELSDKLDKFVKGIEEESKANSREKNTYEQLFAYIAKDIQQEFQPLLTGKLPDIIKWCVDKGYIQQALTFCSEELPQYLWDEGIFKAKDESEYDDFLKKMREVQKIMEENKNRAESDKIKIEKKIKKAVGSISQYFTKGCEDKMSDRYAYRWFVNYLQHLEKLNYREILSSIGRASACEIMETYEQKKEKLEERFNQVNYLKQYMQNEERYQEARQNIASQMAKIFWQYENGRIQTTISDTRKEVLEEIIFTYFFMKGQRNATNHADGRTDGFEYAEICGILNHLVEIL